MDKLVRKAEEIMRAGDQIIEKKKRMGVMIRRITASSAGLCTIIAVYVFTLKNNILFLGNHNSNDEIIINENVDVPVQEITYAIYCNEHGFHFPEQVICTHGMSFTKSGQTYLRCPFYSRERHCPCRQFKYSPEKASQLKKLENFYWSKEK